MRKQKGGKKKDSEVGGWGISFANDALFLLVHFRIVTLTSTFVPVNDQVRVSLGRRTWQGNA